MADASKLVSFAVINSGAENASKLVSYAVLNSGAENASKLVSYAVLMGAMPSGAAQARAMVMA